MMRSLRTGTRNGAPCFMDIRKHIQRLTVEGDYALRSSLEAIHERQKTSPIILFGAGEGGLRMKELFDREGIIVSFFTDNASGKWSGIAAGIPILSPKEAAAVPDAFFVISTSDMQTVSRQLHRMGIASVDQHLYLMTLTRSKRPVFARHVDELSRVRALLHDARSLKTFDALLAQTYALHPVFLQSVYDENQYFFDRHFALRAGETFVDAGAFTGDTVLDAVRRFGRRFKAIYCFEPNAENFTALRRLVKKKRLTKKVILYNCGLSDRRDLAYFSGSGAGYHMTSPDDASREAIPSTTIDDVFKSEPVDFIKMDIEGAEPLALKGAVKVITRDMPRLAICIYHAPEHFFEIPLWLAKLVPKYSFYLRHHHFWRDETVWYAR